MPSLSDLLSLTLLLSSCSGVTAFLQVKTLVTLSTQPLQSSPPLWMVTRGPPPSRGGRRPPVVDENRPVMNLEITANEMRVVTPNPGGKDEALGIMSRAEALAKAKELGGLDLILINNNSDPPVCKIVDYSKYRYSQEKKAKEVKKNSKASEVKEIKMSYKIDVHDYDVRIKSASKFLKQGNRVKCTVMFRGREVQHDNLGFELLEKLSTELEDVSLSEGKAKREGRNLSLMLSPRPDVMKAISDLRRAEEKAKKKKKELEKALEMEQKKGNADEAAQNAQNSALDDLLNSNN